MLEQDKSFCCQRQMNVQHLQIYAEPQQWVREDKPHVFVGKYFHMAIRTFALKTWSWCPASDPCCFESDMKTNQIQSMEFGDSQSRERVFNKK